ncbi:MAG: ATP-binding protein [Bullifex sp.]
MYSSDYGYVVLDDYLELETAKNDPALFFRNNGMPVIIDEVQKAPELFLHIKCLVDKSESKGEIILTGSQSYRLLSNVSDSLAGRVCIIDMSSLSMREKQQINLNVPFIPTEEYIDVRRRNVKRIDDIWFHIQKGSMPELIDEDIEWESFYRSYVRTYLERDVAELINTKNLLKFSSFMRCLAARTGELINYSALSNDIGVSVKTVQEWTSILESSGIIRLLRPYEKSISNRSIKTPKVYFMDTGLVCYLVGWTNRTVAMNGAMSGALFETFCISEIIKSYYNAGFDTQRLYFYRDRDQREIDLIIERDGVIYPAEIKKAAKLSSDMAKHFNVFHEIGKGCILCQCEKPYYLKDDVIALPIEYV